MNRKGTPVPALHMRTISLKHCSVLNTHTLIMYMSTWKTQFCVRGEVPSEVPLRVDVSLVVTWLC